MDKKKETNSLTNYPNGVYSEGRKPYLPDSPLNQACQGLSFSLYFVTGTLFFYFNGILYFCKTYKFAMWIIPAFISASLLGLYDVFKKVSLSGNAVLPVLFLNVLFCCLLLSPIVILSCFFPDTIRHTAFFLPSIPGSAHALLLLKAVIVLSSWTFAYFAIKHLPLTIASPIKATQPILTLAGAVCFWGERLNVWQWSGILLALVSLYLLSWSGKKEGIRFSRNKWILFMVLAIVSGALSGLYDKFLMTRIDRMNVQIWFNFYQLFLMGGIVLILWYPQRKHTTPFRWKWTIPFISLFLVLADFAYFYALSHAGAMISVISLVRRSGVIVTFIAGAVLFREKNLKTKFIDLILVIAGMLLIYKGTE